MLELYHNDMSVCSQKVRLTLREKELNPVERHLNLRQSDQFDPDYLKLNPNGVVPTLLVDGHPVTESTLICEYLDEAHPEPPLRPDDLFERAVMRRFANIPDQGLHAACAVISSAIAFRHQYLALSKDELATHLAATPDLARRERKRVTIEHGMASPAAIKAVNLHDRVLGKIDDRLDGRDWLAGGAYSLAEANLTPYIVRLDHLQLGWMWDKRPRVASWYERIAARPNFAGIADYLNHAYLTLMAEKGTEAQPQVQDALAA